MMTVIGKGFVRQTRLGIQELKRYFNEAPSGGIEETSNPPKCFYLNDIGYFAVIDSDEEATQFLIDSLSHDDGFVRFGAAVFLGSLLHSHPRKWEAYRALKDLALREKDGEVKDMVLYSRMLLKKKLGNNHRHRPLKERAVI